jgi:hypothetical protein
MVEVASEQSGSAELQRVGRSLWIAIGGVAILLVAGIVSAAVLSRQHVASYPAGSPAWTVQRYLSYLQQGQVDQAYDMSNIQDGPFGEPMTRAQFHQQFDNWSQTSHRVTLVRSSRHDDQASVDVAISSFSAGPFGSSSGTQRTTFTLERHGKHWVITGPFYLPT